MNDIVIQLDMLAIKVINHIKYRIRKFRKISFFQFLYSLYLPRKVLYGPFKDMYYLHSSTGSVILPKLIGTYELELQEIIYNLREKKYDAFFDIGAAEGYYAVGMIKFIIPTCKRKVAYESTWAGRRLMKKLALLNEVNIQIKGHCSLNNLKEEIKNEYTLIVMDIEGGEKILLDPQAVDFSFCDILVELHPNVFPTIETILKERFSQSHDISSLQIQSRKFPKEINLPSKLKKHKDYLMNEFRGPQSWLWMECNSAKN